ncbi:hypothetical protein [Rehaibacterium terrae]|jgi:hypothetical protein|uniref:Uncharacterized protein n=1 Tax=Rehaibacterium terrae TaxID=1341696 RepID=A0A7W8DEE9_9GAMM|nr:hypothetical protein [Rehaibacterium terrae]MBB5015660.1 hypothetical protein [Rehaibacterium terrae]
MRISKAVAIFLAALALILVGVATISHRKVSQERAEISRAVRSQVVYAEQALLGWCEAGGYLAATKRSAKVVASIDASVISIQDMAMDRNAEHVAASVIYLRAVGDYLSAIVSVGTWLESPLWPIEQQLANLDNLGVMDRVRLFHRLTADEQARFESGEPLASVGKRAADELFQESVSTLEQRRGRLVDVYRKLIESAVVARDELSADAVFSQAQLDALHDCVLKTVSKVISRGADQ